MFEKLFVGRNHLRNRRKKAAIRFSNQKPTSDDFTPEEEKQFLKMHRPLLDKMSKILREDCHHPQIKEIVRDFKKCGYNLSKFDKKYAKKLAEMNDFLKTAVKKHKDHYSDTTVELYIEAYAMLQDLKLRASVNKIGNNFKKLFKDGAVNFKDIPETHGFAYCVGEVVLVLYIMLLVFCILYMALAVIFMLSGREIKYNHGHESVDTTDEHYFDIDKFEKEYAPFVLNVAYPTTEFMEFFRKTPTSKLESGSIKIVNKLGKENLNNDKNGLTDDDLAFIKDKYGYEDFGIILAVGVGIILLMIVLFPTIRNFIYYIESLKVDISDFYNEEAELLGNNILKLEERLANAKTPAERKHLEEVIAKQRQMQAKMIAKSEKYYVAQIEAEKNAESEYTKDERIYEEQDKEESRPQILI